MTRRRSRGPAGGVVPRRSRPGAASRSRAAGHRGMVTVEAAIAVPLLLAVGLLAAGAPGVVGAHIRCADAAREAALMVARDLPVAEAEATVASSPPGGADVGAGARRHRRGRGGSQGESGPGSAGSRDGSRREWALGRSPRASGSAVSPERGTATLVGTYLAGAVLVLALVLASLSSVVALRHRAGVAADLAALAGAQAWVGGPAPVPGGAGSGPGERRPRHGVRDRGRRGSRARPVIGESAGSRPRVDADRASLGVGAGPVTGCGAASPPQKLGEQCDCAQLCPAVSCRCRTSGCARTTGTRRCSGRMRWPRGWQSSHAGPPRSLARRSRPRPGAHRERRP